MHEIILCKLGEVVLKGLNRRSFEMKLMSNIRRRTQRFGKWKIYSRQSTIYVEPAEDTCDIAEAYAACKQVFGIIAITRALPCEKSKEAIFDTARTYLGGALTAAKSFKVESKRADKSFPMGSIQLSQWVGGALHDAFPHLTVDVHHPELTVYIEVREDAAYVHGPSVPGAGGLPVGCGGTAVTLLVNQENSFKTAAAQEIADSLRRAGLSVTVEAVPWETYLQRLQDGSFDLYYGECRLTADWDILELVGTTGSLNYGGFSDEKTDSLLAVCRTTDDTQRSAALASLWEDLLAKTPIAPLCFKSDSVVTTTGLVDGLVATETDPFFSLTQWTVHLDDPPKAK